MATQSPTTTVAPATQLPRTGSSSTTLLLAYAAIVTLLGGFLTLVRRSSGPATD
jgi:LPXTG-motif cell wall-anchored protein